MKKICYIQDSIDQVIIIDNLKFIDTIEIEWIDGTENNPTKHKHTKKKQFQTFVNIVRLFISNTNR